MIARGRKIQAEYINAGCEKLNERLGELGDRVIQINTDEDAVWIFYEKEIENKSLRHLEFAKLLKSKREIWEAELEHVIIDDRIQSVLISGVQDFKALQKAFDQILKREV